MSLSSRNRRVVIYPYAASDNVGYTTSGYGPKRGAFFARVSPIPGFELTAAEQADHRERCVFEFDLSVPVGLDDLVEDHRGVQWKVEAAQRRENGGAQALVVRAVRNTDEPAVVPA